jgi:hypothetical protein
MVSFGARISGFKPAKAFSPIGRARNFGRFIAQNVQGRLDQITQDPQKGFSTRNLSEDELDHVLASQLSYGDIQNLPAGYEYIRHNDEIGELRRGQRSIVTFRGTKTAQDAVTDAQIPVVGSSHRRYREALDKTRTLLQQQPGRQFTVSGHSLGGSIADYVGSELGLQGHVFNPYTRVTDKDQSVQAHCIVGDIVCKTYGGLKNLIKVDSWKNYVPGLRHVHGHFLDQFGTKDQIVGEVHRRQAEQSGKTFELPSIPNIGLAGITAL